MTLNQIDNDRTKKKSLIKELDLSENDKYSLWKYLGWKDYKTKGRIKTDSISDPQGFFKQINSFSIEQKGTLLKELNEHFSNRERVYEDKENIQKINKDKETSKLSQEEMVTQLKKQLDKIDWKVSIWIQIYNLSIEDKIKLYDFLKNDIEQWPIELKSILDKLDFSDEKQLFHIKKGLEYEISKSKGIKDEEKINWILDVLDLKKTDIQLLSTLLDMKYNGNKSREEIEENYLANERVKSALKKFRNQTNYLLTWFNSLQSFREILKNNAFWPKKEVNVNNIAYLSNTDKEDINKIYKK